MAADAANETTGGAQEPNRDGSGAIAPQSEWTASDRRGPLSAAGEHPAEGEGYGPGGETPGSETKADRPASHGAESVGGESHEAGGLDAPRTDLPVDAPASPPEGAGVDAVAAHPEPVNHARRSPVALVSGLILGAIVGAGSAAVVYALAPGGHHQQNADSAEIAGLASRVDALEKRPDLEGAVGQLRQQVTALRQGGSATGKDANKTEAALDGKVASLQAEVDALRKASGHDSAGSAGQTKAFDGLQTSVATAQREAAAAQSDVAGLTAKQKDLADKVASMQSALGTTKSDASSARSELGAMQSQQKALQSQQKDLQSQQKDLEARVNAPALAVVADSLVDQVAAGKPYQRQVDALSGLNADPAKMAVLKQDAEAGVPSAQTLLAQFKPLGDAIVATGSRQPANAGFVQRLRSGLTGLVSVRREGATGGTDLASRVATIEADLAHDDVTGAYSVWQALPAPAKHGSQDWGARAKTSVEAITAARDLRGDAINALGGKRS